MLKMSDNAASYLTHAQTASGLPGSVGVRLSMRNDGDQDAIRVSFANLPDPADSVIERNGARVFVAEELNEILADRVLDTEVEDETERLVLRPSGPAAS